MDLIDIVLLVIVAVAAVNGLRQGAASLIFAYGAFFVGLTFGWMLGKWLSTPIANHVSSQIFRLLLGITILFLPAMIVGTLGHILGLKVKAWLDNHHLKKLDDFLGIIVAVFLTLLVAWLMGSVLANTPSNVLNSQIQRSSILRSLDKSMPNLPLDGIQKLIADSGFPSVFTQFAPLPPGSTPEASPIEVNTIVNEVGSSVVKITGVGCGQIQEGTGFVVSPGLVATNAHVVAGIPNPVVIDASGTHSTRVVYFDPNFDLAILRVRSLAEPPLSFDTSILSNGTKAVFIGYPNGGPFNAQAGAILGYFPQAQGSDIYNQGSTVRSVYEIEGLVRPGNSGGPLFDLNGKVAGIVFSRSTSFTDVGFALSANEVASRVNAALTDYAQVSTGQCTS